MKVVVWFILLSLSIENIYGQEINGDGWFQLPFRTPMRMIKIWYK